MNIKSKVMTMANALVKQGVSRSAAMVCDWIKVKLRRMEVRAAGVTHGNRQTLLDHLTRYKPEDITVTLRREQNNAHDRNAIQIVAAVRNKGTAVIGYIKHFAKEDPWSWFKCVKHSITRDINGDCYCFTAEYPCNVMEYVRNAPEWDIEVEV